MSAKNIIKKGLSFGFQPKRWIGLDQVKSNGQICLDLAKNLINSKAAESKPEEIKSIEEQMTASELKSRKTLALRLCGIYIFTGICLISYAFFLWFSSQLILAGGVSFLMAFLVLMHALRELLVYGKIRSLKNKLTLKELLRFVIKGFPK